MLLYIYTYIVLLSVAVLIHTVEEDGAFAMPAARLGKLCTQQIEVHKVQIEVCKADVELHKAYVGLHKACAGLNKAYVGPHKAKYTDMLGTQDARKPPELTQPKSPQGTKTV